MASAPEIAILISTFQRPLHLYRCLLSLAAQVKVDNLFEVVVTDDGSDKETLELVRYFAQVANFPIQFTSHPHQGFQLSRCRNEGVALSTAPYILITDGDCVFPRDHVHWHLRFRKPGAVVAGDCYRLSRVESEKIDEDAIRGGNLHAFADEQQRGRIRWKALRGFFYSRTPFKMRPRLTGNNIGVWRDDLERVNGFDENFVGWGLEDRDLQRRLMMSGVRSRSILHRTAAYHLWHPAAPSFARNNLGTKNYEYYHQRAVSMRCEVGLAERSPSTRDLLLSGVREDWNRSLPQSLQESTVPSCAERVESKVA